jgi:AcrR family transcriptional regulator
MSSGRPDTRRAILLAARELFEAQGYFGAGLEAVAKKAGVSRQAIYLHFASKADLLTDLHLDIYRTDVLPALQRRPIWTAPTALAALDASTAVDAEVASKVWRLHEALVVARRHHPEVEETLRPREAERYGEVVRLARWLKKDGHLPTGMRVGEVADVYWGLTSTGTFVNLVVERGWSVDRFAGWARDTVRLHLAAPELAARQNSASSAS